MDYSKAPYDGHGSTRQLVNTDLSIQDSYDAYGVMLGDSTHPNPAQTAATSLLYAGEQYDTAMQHYYLRARYYNPANGLFNQTDPYSGNLHDPQSLHKYLYCHANPVNGIDPTGMFFITTMISTLWVQAKMFGMRTADAYHKYKQYSRAEKMLTAIGVGLIISQAAIAYVTGGASINLAFSKCPLIRDRDNWPDINISFSYRHNVNNMFSQMSKLKIGISKQKKWDMSGGDGYVGIGGSGSFVYDFITGKPDATGSFRGRLRVPYIKRVL